MIRERWNVQVDGFEALQPCLPAKSVYLYEDLIDAVRQVQNGIAPLRTVDRWIEHSGIVRKNQTPRTSTYRKDDVKQFLLYMVFRKNVGGKRAKPAFYNYMNYEG